MAGADLRKRRRRRADCSNLPAASSLPLTTDAAVAQHFPQQIDKKEYFAFYSHPKFLTLEQGQLVMERQLQDLGFVVSPTLQSTPRDGNCMFHALANQLTYYPRLRDEAKSDQELRWKIVNYGYDFFLKTGKLPWHYLEETPKEWKQKMSRVGEWGDDVALNLACNVLGVTIIIVVASEESPVVIKCLEHRNPEPLYLFYFSETNFSPAHYECICPESSSTPSLVPVTQEEESLQELVVMDSLLDVPVVIDDSQVSEVQISSETFNSVQVIQR